MEVPTSTCIYNLHLYEHVISEYEIPQFVFFYYGTRIIYYKSLVQETASKYQQSTEQNHRFH